MKKYLVTVGENSFTIEAVNLKSAKDIAQHNKRHLNYKGITKVRILKP